MAGYFIVLAAIMFPILGKTTMLMAEIGIENEQQELSDDETFTILQERVMELFRDFHDKVILWMPLLTIVILAVGFFVCVRMLKRKES